MSSSRPLAIVTGARRALDMSLPNAASGRDLTSLSQPTSRPSMRPPENSAAWAPRSRRWKLISRQERELTGCMDRFRGSRSTHCLRTRGMGRVKGFWIKISTTYATSSIRT